MSAKFDFREGMLLEKMVYKDTSCDWKSRLMYIGFLLLTWTYGAAWFALFFYCYIFHEDITFWVFIACWIVHVGVLVGKGSHTLFKAKQKKEMKQKLKEEIIAQENKLKQVKQTQDLIDNEHENKTSSRIGEYDLNSLNQVNSPFDAELQNLNG